MLSSIISPINYSRDGRSQETKSIKGSYRIVILFVQHTSRNLGSIWIEVNVNMPFRFTDKTFIKAAQRTVESVLYFDAVISFLLLQVQYKYVPAC